jgi:hypothetical protein
MPTRTGGNRANWSPINPTKLPNYKNNADRLVGVNVPGILSSVPNTPFPRIDPKSTVSNYPGINNILVNQKEDDDSIRANGLEREVLRDQVINGPSLPARTNTLRSGALNTLQNALVDACQHCVSGRCANCPSCLNGQTSHPKADSIASNKVDAKSIGDIDDQTEYMTLENFDSGLTSSTVPSKFHKKLTKRLVRHRENFDSGLGIGLDGISSKMHDNLSKKLINKHQVFASVNDNEVEDDNHDKDKNNKIENFDSGLAHHNIPTKVHKRLAKKLVDARENFDSGISHHGVPAKVHHRLAKKLVKRQENFDSGVSNHSMPSKLHDNLSNKLMNKHPLFAPTNGDEDKDEDDVENFDSGITHHNMPSKMHHRLAKKLVRSQENFDSGVSHHNMPAKMHHRLAKKLVKSQENFDSGIGHHNMPAKMHHRLAKKLVKRQENFDNDHNDDDDNNEVVELDVDYNDPLIDLNNPLRANTDGCANCPQSRCVNCPHRQNICADSNSNCALGYPSSTCKNMDMLNSRDQLADSDDSKRENFDCACRRKAQLVPATDLGQKKLPADLENFECSLNPDSNECNQCSKCPGCRNSQCPTCPKGNLASRENFSTQHENFSSVGFDTLCPCANARCANCPLCRAGNCPTCPKNNQTGNPTYIDLASLGNWAGGYRLGGDWNDATPGPNPININNSVVYYPDSYVGSYFINPKPDIMYPYSVIPPSRTVSGLVVDS